MRKTTKFFSTLGVVLLLIGSLFLTSCGKYKYETVPNDPMKARIYTLENGLKVYLSVNKNEPRIQTMIAVRAGGKNDPAETTGLAHYFEHLMFKGTKSFGTVNYAEEEKYLNEIRDLFEEYRKLTDPAERKAIYHVIDSISQIASGFAIPNEYDKLMSAIGAQGTNAFTSYDMTAYVEDIPSNQVENWLKIQSDRFQNPIIRLFHTELETVYEEYNMSLSSDSRTVFDSVTFALFPHHPYGTQTVIGTQENLKNPSIVNIENFYKAYYVPNNMAVIMCGDFDPDKVIKQIDQYFGTMKPSDKIPELKTTAEQEITAPIEKTVIGNDPAFVTMAFRLPNASTEGMEVAEIMDKVMNNGYTGLVDINLIQKQYVLDASAGYDHLSDCGLFYFNVTPRQGQSLEEARDLMLEQIEKVKKGEFSEEMLTSIIDNKVKDDYYQLRHNVTRSYQMLESFINMEPWAEEVSKMDRLSKITKEDVVNFANKYFKDNYVIVYKREGTPKLNKIDKPQITPIKINRDTSSEFLKQIQLNTPEEIEPVFIDFDKDIAKSNLVDQVQVLSIKNNEDPLFSLDYVFDMGRANDKDLQMAFQYLKYLGTDKYTPEELQNEFYKLAVNFEVSAYLNRVYVRLRGLDKNLEASVALMEHVLSSVKADAEVYANLVADEIKSRENDKKDQGARLQQMLAYAYFGADNPRTYVLSNTELKNMDPEILIGKIKSLTSYPHKVVYYGPRTEADLVKLLKEEHKTPAQFMTIPEEHKFNQIDIDGKTVFIAQYDAPQVYLALVSRSEKYNTSLVPFINMYQMYFGGGMSGIVFQEMREARALAYMAYMSYMTPTKPTEYFNSMAIIATQVDKMAEATKAFEEIIYDMPMAQKTFDVAKENYLNSFRTTRKQREEILWYYLRCQDFGYDTDWRKGVYEQVLTMTLEDVKEFQEKYVKTDSFDICVLGNIKDMDLNFLKTQGNIVTLTPEIIFGY